MKSCTTFTGRHKYEARYDEKPNELGRDVALAMAARSNNHRLRVPREATEIRVYVHDICIHCGDVVARAEDKP